MAIINMAGKVFGRWTVLDTYRKHFPDPASKYFDIYWTCRCECGTVEDVRGKNLRKGVSQSCRNCRIETQRAAVTTHGMSRSRIYRIFNGMHRRCSDPEYDGFHNYGGRNITVCARWEEFDNFYTDMVDGYRDDLTIERMDNNGNYEPGNCCWIPKGDQTKNRRPSSEWRRKVAS